MRVPSIVGAIGAIILAAALACGPEMLPRSTISHHICPTLMPPGEILDTVTVALFDDVEPLNAPNWTNQSEQIVFGHLYETLSVEFGSGFACGRRRLATPELSEDGRVARFTLRDNARFWDGTRVTVGEVADVLKDAMHDIIGIDSVVALDDKTIEVHVFGREFQWSTLESPKFAIVRRGESRWPVGTGVYRIISDDYRGTIAQPTTPGNDPIVRFIHTQKADPRDLMDSSYVPKIDVMVVNDSASLEYAQDQGSAFVSLGPTKAYVVLAPSRGHALQEGRAIPAIPPPLSKALASDAIRAGIVRPLGEEHAGWARLNECTSHIGSPWGTRLPSVIRILFDRSDPTAQDIAERIASIASGDTATSPDAAAIARALPGLTTSAGMPVAIGLDESQFAVRLERGDEFAYVTSTTFNRPESCFLVVELQLRAPWLASSDASIERKLLPIALSISYVIAARSRQGFGYDLQYDRYGGFIVVGRD